MASLSGLPLVGTERYSMIAIPHSESDEDLLFLMSNVFPRHTGLPSVVWISPRGNAQHAAHVKVSLRPKMVPSEMITVTIDPPVEVIDYQGRD